MTSTPATAEPGDPVAALFAAACRAHAHAYAPYSQFHVGAAIRSSSGVVYAGCNVENAAYPQGWCAEASAIAAMVTAGERRISEVLVVTDGDDLGTCCGGCRQKLREFAPLDTLVHVAGLEGVRRVFTLGELLPASFGPENLEHNHPGPPTAPEGTR
ncbi:MAG: cytidine deaminase [Ilumatobacteraceae bacterium]|jgi:cytidine deaminase